jgi:cystathionine beta-lyase/cystathionine gamma-synthase
VVAGRRGAIEAIRAVSIDTGGIVSPFSAFLVLRGLQTLHVRMDRHRSSWRGSRGRTRRCPVVYRGCPVIHRPSRPAPAARGGGMLAVDLRGRARPAFIDALRIPPVTATMGGRPLRGPSATATHRQLTGAAAAPASTRAGAGVGRARGRG